MKKYMQDHLNSLRTRLDINAKHKNWSGCIRLEARIQEAEHLYTEMLRSGLIDPRKDK